MKTPLRPTLATLLAASACLVASVSYAAGTYYVDASSPTCSVAGPGTEAKPYCTISAALSAHNGPGVTILVKPGVYREQVTIPASGSPGNPFVLQALGAGVVVDGADDFSDPARWTLVSGNVWLAASVGWSPLQVFADGARLAASTADPAALPSGSFRWVSGTGLYVNAGGGNPADHQARVGRRTNGLIMAGRNSVRIDGFTFTRTEDRAISLTGSCANVTLTHNTVTFANGSGIYVSGGSGIVIGSSTASDNNDHGIALTSGATGCTIEDNESFRNARPTERAANGIYLYGSPGNVLRRNRLHDNQDTGLHVQTGSNNCIEYLNRSWNNGDHGYDHLGATGTIHVCDVAYGNYKDGFSIEGNAIATQLYNCIAVENGLTTDEFDLWIDAGSVPGFVSDYNIFWNSTSQPPVKYISTLYSSVADYGAASGQDANSLQADPRFVNPSAGDFRLQAGSPAIDNGTSAVPNWPATDAAGRPRVDVLGIHNLGAGPILYADRGALEHMPISLALTPPSGTAPLTVTVDATGSVGPDGTAASFRFDFGDGTVVGPQPGPTATHTYAAGTWTATVTVNDQTGGSSSASATAAANARPHAALTTHPVSGKSPLTVTVDASASSDSDGAVASYRFDFGDGSSAGPQSSPIATHAYDIGSWTPRVTVTDNLGAADSALATASVVVGPPNVPPVARLSASLLSGEPPLDVTADASQSTDSDGTVASYRFDFGDGTVVGPQPSPTASHSYGFGVWTLTVTAVDDDGGSSTASETVTVDGAPRVTVPAAVSAPEASPLVVTVRAVDSDGQAITSLTADLSGLPAGNDAAFAVEPGDSVGTLTWTPSYDDSGSYVVHFTAANGLSGTATTVISVTHVDRAPVVAAPNGAAAAETSPFTLTVGAADPDGEAIGSLTADLSGLPSGNDAVFTVEPGDSVGTLTWTPTYADAGSYSVHFTAANAVSGSATTQISVANRDRAPAASAPAAASAVEGSPVTVTVRAADPDAEPIGTLTADLSGLPPGNDAVFTVEPGDSVGTLNWTPTYYDAGSYAVHFTAANGLPASTTTLISVSDVNGPPSIVVPATVWAVENSPLTLMLRVADPDGDAIDSFTADLASLPAGNDGVFTVDPGDSTATLTWTPTFADSGRYAVRFAAANAQSDSATVLISVANLDRAPVVTASAAEATAETSEVTVTVQAVDPDGDEIGSLTADLSALPGGNDAVFTPGPGNTTGTLTWTPTYADSGRYAVRFDAGNARLGSATTHISVINVDRPPTLAAPATEPAAEGSPLVLTVQVSDPDGDAIDSLTAELSGLPPGSDAVFTPGPGNATGTLSWTPTYDDSGTYSVHFTAANALSDSATTTITVAHVDRPPAVAAAPTAAAAEASAFILTVRVADPDGEAIGSLTADLSGLPAGSDAAFAVEPGDSVGALTWTPTYADSGSYLVHFTAANALSGSATTVISVANLDRAPIVAAPATQAVGEASPLTLTVRVADPDGEAIGSLTADLSGLPAGSDVMFAVEPGDSVGTLTWTPTYADFGSYPVWFTATNTLSGSATTMVTVLDVDEAPSITAPASATVSEASVVTVVVQAVDFDGDDIGSLTADLSALPAGHDAVFAVEPGNDVGTLTWTPTHADSGHYPVHFTAANALSRSATTVISVTNLDRAPSVAAPATLSVIETHPVSVTVQVADPDGDPISSLTADLSGLPAGSNASFSAAPGDSVGTLTWTPTYADAGSYAVHFAAANALPGTATTVISVDNLDRAPTVSAPAAVTHPAEMTLTANVTAADPDGEAITSLTADLSGLPAGNNAVFTPGSDNSTGTLTWTPNAGQTGTYSVTFTAANGGSGAAVTSITVTPPNQPPVAALDVSPASGNEPLTVVADGSGSSDHDGTIASYRFDFGDGTVAGPQAGTSASHAYAPGSWTLTLSVTDNHGAVAQSSRSILVAEVGRGPNLVANPSFETGTTGWGPHNGSTIQRVAGGFDGGYSLQMTGPASTAIFGLNDAPNWVATTPAAGARYRFSAWVRSASAGGSCRLRVREYLNGVRIGAVGYFSNTVELSPAWSQLYQEYLSQAAGSTLDLQVEDVPRAAGEVFEVDNLSIRVDRPPSLTAADTASVQEASPLGVTVRATDPDGDPVGSLTADLSGLPPGNDAVFTVEPGDTLATLTWTPSHTDSGSYSVTFTAANDLSGSAITVISVTNLDRAPTVAARSTGAAEGSPLTLVVRAADPDGDAIGSLSADLSGLPPGSDAAFTVEPGDSLATLTWTPTYADAGSYWVTFTAANALSGSATTLISVSNVNGPPSITAPATVSVSESSVVAVSVRAADPDGDAIGSLSADLSGLPPGSDAAFTVEPGDSVATLTWIPTYADAGSYSVQFTAANDLSSSATTVISVTNLDRAPTVAAPSTGAAAEGSPFTLTVRAADPDGEAIGSLTADLTGLPPGNDAVFTVEPGDSTGTLIWTPSYGDVGSYSVAFTAANALSGSATTVISVTNLDRAPTVAAPSTGAAAEGSPLTLTVRATDPDGDAIDSLSADVSGLPPGNDAVFTVAPGDSVATLTWTPTYADAGSYSVHFTAANDLSGSATTVISVANRDRSPTVTAPRTSSVVETNTLTLTVRASDPDGDAIGSLTVDLSDLPGDDDVEFTVEPGDSVATLTWTPTYADAGSYSVHFTAANALSGSATTVISVDDLDRPPAVTAPASVTAGPELPIIVSVHAADPDGQPIDSLGADLSGLPAWNHAVFTPGPGDTTGTLTWTPGYGDAGSYTVRFTALNAGSGSATTSITVTPPNQPPVAAFSATPLTGVAPLEVAADASGSSDPDGTIAAYRFDFGDGTVIGPQADPAASHVYGPGNWTLVLTVTDDQGTARTAHRSITVAAAGSGANLVGNPSFEADANGWASYNGATLHRVPGGFDGSYCLQLIGPNSIATFGTNDAPNWVATTPAAGTRYRISAWVRSAGSGGSCRLRVREYLNGVRIGANGYLSNPVALSPAWDELTQEYVAQRAGSTVDLQIENVPAGVGETFQIDNVSIRIVSPAPPARAEPTGPAAAGSPASPASANPADPIPLRPTLLPTPVRSAGILAFATSRPGQLRVELCDLQGRRVRRLADDPASPAGWHRFDIDGRDDAGSPLPSGIYFYRVQAAEGVVNGRFVFIR